MKIVLRGFAILIGLAVLGVAILVGCARSGLLISDEAALRAKYMLPASKFIDIGGEPIHYTDEGSGDAIVMIHGSLGSLLMWNDWVKALSGHYRIIRFDRPPMGLSGPDPENRYGVDREIAVIEGLTDRLGLNKFFLVATSSGGASGAAYAARHPERIEGIVLSNIAPGPLKVPASHTPWILRQMRVIDPILKEWRAPVEWRAVLENNMVNHDRISDALVTQWTDFNNREVFFIAAQQPRPSVSPFDRAPDDLAKINAPALVLWSAGDTEIPPNPNADKTMKYLGSQDKTLTLVPHCEHMMPLDCGPESVALALPFFDRVSGAGQ